MQIIESSAIGVRAARRRFVSKNGNLSVTVFPMLHVGEQRFYKEVYYAANEHDYILTEGVKSPIVSRITRSYRWLPLHRLGLIVQPKIPRLVGKTIDADLNEEEFKGKWKQLPTTTRIAVPLLVFLIVIKRRITLTRSLLSVGLSLDGQTSRKDLLQLDKVTTELNSVILDDRDERLCSVLLGLVEELGDNKASIAIVYGARHMRELIRVLHARGFRSEESDWITVFST